MLPAAAISGMKTALEADAAVIETGEPVDRPDLLVGIEDIMQLMGYDDDARARSAARRRAARRRLSMQRLPDRVALVTGAAGGLGRAIALRFAQEGAQLCLLDRASVSAVRAEVEAQGAQAIAFTADVTDSSAIDAARSTRRSRTSAASTCSSTSRASARTAPPTT